MWKLKTDDDGNPVVKDGLPVFTDPDADEELETMFDPNQLEGKIKSLKSENARRREQYEKLEAKHKAFAEIEDPETFLAEAREALEKVDNLKDKDLKVAERTEKLKAEMKQTHEEQIAKIKTEYENQLKEKAGTIEDRDSHIRTLMVSNRFARSPLFSGQDPKTILPPDIAETYFGKHFKVQMENGDKPKLVAYDTKGEQIHSRQRIGELADFDEAIEIIFNQYPGKEKVIRSTEGGSGGTGGTGVSARTPIEKLQKQYEQAQKDGDVTQQISLKNRMFELQQQK